MKICFFHLMPYRFLPDDFETRYRSVWVDVPHTCSTRRSQRALPRVPGRAGVRRASGLRRRLRQRAPQQRLRADALAEPHGRRADPPDLARRDHRAGQQPGRLQPAAAGGRGVRHARPPQRRPAGGRLPGRHVDGHELRLRDQPGDAARALLRGPRPRHPGLDAARGLRLQRQVHAGPLREHLAPAAAEAAPAGVDSRAAAASRRGSGRPSSTTSTATSPTSATSGASRRWTASGKRSPASASTTTPTARASCSSSAWPTPTPRPSALYHQHVHYFYQKCLHVWEGFAEAPGYRTIEDARPGSSPRSARRPGRSASPSTGRATSTGLRDRRQPGNGPPAAHRVHPVACASGT